jgi:RNA polymerase sigma-70 factor (ECF subfamily)
MNTTSLSLLQRLRNSGHSGLPFDRDAWDRFLDLYYPLVLHWAKAETQQEADAADLVADVFHKLLRGFSFNPAKDRTHGGQFRNWLRKVVRHQWLDMLRRRKPSVPVQETDLQDLDHALAVEEEEYNRYLVSRVFEVLAKEFSETTRRAFVEHGVNGRVATEVAAELGLSVGAVYAARFRVLTRLRQELEGLLD